MEGGGAWAALSTFSKLGTAQETHMCLALFLGGRGERPGQLSLHLADRGWLKRHAHTRFASSSFFSFAPGT